MVARSIAGCSGGSAVHDAYFHSRFRCPAPGVSWPDRFVILSAQATTGEHWSEAENEAADRQLEMALSDWDCWCCRLVGYSPDSGHAEPGWAADLSVEAGLELGRTFLQDAIYLVEGQIVRHSKRFPNRRAGETDEERFGPADLSRPHPRAGKVAAVVG
jgi:hypothetical protein